MKIAQINQAGKAIANGKGVDRSVLSELPRPFKVPSLLAVLLGAVLGFWQFWLDPTLTIANNELASLTGQRDQLANDLAQAAADLSLVKRLAADYRNLERRGVLQPQDRLALGEALDARLIALGIPNGGYRFLPLVETKIDVGGVALLRRTVPLEITLSLVDDLQVLDFVRLDQMPHSGLLRVRTLTLRRADDKGQAGVTALADIRLDWITLAAPLAVGAP